jgi:hypothetical protein
MYWLARTARTFKIVTLKQHTELRWAKDKGMGWILTNGRESAVNRALDGSTYLDLKPLPFSLCKKNLLLRNAPTYSWDW